jgi:hypothetical protein
MRDWIFNNLPSIVIGLFLYATWLHMQAMKQRKNVSNLWKTLKAHGIRPGPELGPRMGKISFWEMWSGYME